MANYLMKNYVYVFQNEISVKISNNYYISLVTV